MFCGKNIHQTLLHAVDLPGTVQYLYVGDMIKDAVEKLHCTTIWRQ